MDTKIENLDLLRSFILKLTDHDIFEIESISLTSAQKARIAAWCENNSIEIPDLKDKSFWVKGVKNKETLKTNVTNIANNKISMFDTDIKVGIDIQKISEFLPNENIISKNSEDLCKIFTKRELSYAESKDAPKETLAGIFALKEAIYKTQNITMKLWNEIEIKYINNKPTFHSFALSISHSGDFAIAIALIRLSKNKKVSPILVEEDLNKTSQSNMIFNFLKKCILLAGIFGGILYLLSFVIIK